MFAKPFKLILIYLLTIINITFVLTPLLAAIAPFIDYSKNGVSIDYNIFQKLKIALATAIFSISFFMLLYMFLDYIFGFSLRSSLKNCKRYDKLKGYEFLKEIFFQTQERFNTNGVKLYIKNSNEVNAYAVSSMASGAVVLTKGLIDHFLVLSKDSKEFLFSLRSIMGHEMSHLVNRDFLPTFFVICNQKATNFVSRVLHYILFFQINFFNRLPYIGSYYSSFIYYTYSFINFILTIFNKYIVLTIYNFLNKFASRSIEYRCDYQSAQAFGGENMVNALEKLGENGYFTIFSTHPKTHSRIKNVKLVKVINSNITAKFFDKVTNYLTTMILITICLYFAKEARIDQHVRQIIRNHEYIHSKLSYLWQLIKQIY
ncbi:protease HtpX [Alphaproteobacteria bacterium]|nr:protease HtpX [Alphaproteobacteria bacterium]